MPLINVCVLHYCGSPPRPPAPAPLKVSTALFHTMAVTASGDVIGCGQNDEGQVQPDLLSEEMLSRPLLVEPLLNHRVTQASNVIRVGCMYGYLEGTCVLLRAQDRASTLTYLLVMVGNSAQV